MSIDYTDRYQALGVPYPEPDTVCKGPCEGLGVYPEVCPILGFHTHNGVVCETKFVPCPDCHGTGKR